MKIGKLLFVLIGLFLIIVIAVYLLILNIKRDNLKINTYNEQYEYYLNKNITGLDLATLINKTINLNEKNSIEKDENNHYIENKDNSIKIEIKLSATKKTYSMEEFYNNDTSEFVKYFAEENFKCVEIKYHKETGKVSMLIFEQL